MEAVSGTRQLTMPSWRIQHVAGDAAAFHGRDLPADERLASFFTVDSAALVLGSSQGQESVDADAAALQGVEIVRRRSGGGGVLLLPGEFVWLDLEMTDGDELWSDDVGKAMWWVGELWRSALADLSPLASVHRGRLIHTRWSADVCFAGTGPGEVMLSGAKLVGIAQRRTRHAARFQTMVHLQWRPDVVASLVAGSPSIEELAPLVRTCPATAGDIVARLTTALSHL
ncbi:MAG: hypothetical protein ABI949_05100 [Ilumatobacteraceae bacterium]